MAAVKKDILLVSGLDAGCTRPHGAGMCRAAFIPDQTVQSSFRIVPVPRLLVNSELLLSPNRSR